MKFHKAVHYIKLTLLCFFNSSKNSSNNIDRYLGEEIFQRVLKYIKLRNYNNILFIKEFKYYKEKKNSLINNTEFCVVYDYVFIRYFKSISSCITQLLAF